MRERIYSSRPRRWDERTQIIVRGVSPWVPLIFHENRLVHETAMFMVETESKYDRRWHWWSPRVPAPIFQLDFVDVPPPGPVSRVLGWALTLYAIWHAR